MTGISKGSQKKTCGALHKYVTVEPILCGFMFCLFLVSPIQEQLVYRKSCNELYSASICEEVFERRDKSFERYEDNVQKETSKWLLYSSAANTLPSILSTLILASISDRVGRKVMITIPFIGCVFQTTALVLNSIYKHLPIGYLLIGDVVSGMFGSYAFVLTSVFSYIADITPKESRTWRVGLLEAMTCVGGSIGEAIGGVMLEKSGFIGVFAIALSIYILCIVYTIFYLKESHFPIQDRSLGKLVCSGEHITHAIKVASKRREGRKRMQILSLLAVMIINVLVISGSTQISILYVKHDPLNWMPSLTGYYLSAAFVTKAAGLILGLPIFSKVLKLEDYTIIILSLTTTMGSYILSGFARTTWLFFFALVIGTLGGLAIPCIRSNLTKTVDVGEQASLMAALSTGDVLAVFLANLMFDNIYYLTVGWYPGFAFFTMAFLLLFPFTAVWYLQCRMESQPTYKPLERCSVEENEQTIQDESCSSGLWLSADSTRHDV